MNNVFTVSQLNSYVKGLFDEDVLLSDISVSGEISNFKKHSSGHLYFTLKDSGSAVSAAMFKWQAQYLRFIPTDGMRVVAKGKITLYEPTGQYQLVVQSLQPDGEGALFAQFEKLKVKLSFEGLFLQERKRPLPKFPSKIGVITSKTGAAIRDILSILERRWPAAEVVLCPTAVQGAEAPVQLRKALALVNSSGNCDLIIIGRGGGSIEDLWAFNDEALVRAVANSKVPIISAVGHETDFTLCDFAADVRAATPSAAAELAVPDRAEMLNYKSSLCGRIRSLQNMRLSELALTLNQITKRRCFTNPYGRIDSLSQLLDSIKSRTEKSIENRLTVSEKLIARNAAVLSAMNPMGVLARGYCVVYDEQSVISSADSINSGDRLKLVFSDGEKGCIAE